MKSVKRVFTDFLDNSTIHGLQYISMEKKFLIKMIWAALVSVSFYIATALIRSSIIAWESPISTNIETLPISEVMLPKVTICPPKGSNTLLNYDIIMAQNKTFSEDSRINAAIAIRNPIVTLEEIKDMFRGCLKFSYHTEPCSNNPLSSKKACRSEINSCNKSSNANLTGSFECQAFPSASTVNYRGRSTQQ